MRGRSIDPMIGQTIGGRYRLIQRLGIGGMSSVYLARHKLIERLMAIKLLRRDLATDPIQRDRFVREARAVNRINHENIVEITDYGESEDGLLYLVMEYVDGDPLLKVMTEEGPFDPLRAFALIEQAGSALARAHQMGVIHRDLKPENMILVRRSEGDGTRRAFADTRNGSERGEILKIFDFGIAKLTDQPSLSGSQQIFGTPGYIAPEYIQSTAIDGRADLYSLGVIFYEMVTGALPFDYEYPGDLLIKHVTEAPIPPSVRRPGIPKSVEDFTLRCLAKKPDQRFRDAFHFLEEAKRARERMTGRIATPTVGLEMERATLVDARDELPTPHLEPRQKPAIASSPPPPEEPTATRANTREYGSRSIPIAPDDSVEIDIAEVQEKVREKAREPRSQSSGYSRSDLGIGGSKRWRERFDALRAALDELELVQAPPSEVDHAMAYASRAVEELEEGALVALASQRALEGLAEKARDYRTTIGRTLDELAAQLSHEGGELEALVNERFLLARTRQEAIVDKDDSRADALLWSLGAVEEVISEKQATFDVLDQQVTDLRAQLERENEQLENEIGVLTLALDREMARLWPLGVSLREPLEIAETYVRECLEREP